MPCSEPPGALQAVLDARTARAWLQSFLLRSLAAGCVVQISLNIPGFPKRLAHDDEALRRARQILLSDTAWTPTAEISLRNAAGNATLLAFANENTEDIRQAKGVAIGIEDRTPWGRVLDIDVITPAGGVSREDLELAPRKCILCAEPAKLCARSRSHPYAALRTRAGELLQTLYISK